MERDRFERAKARLERAWNEAAYRLSRRETPERNHLFRQRTNVGFATTQLSEVFDKLENIPCNDCKRCCTQAAFSSGFHSHVEREAILSHVCPGLPSLTPLDFIVEDWEGEEEPPERCLFLTPKGCNIPIYLRSVQCTTYVCYDRLGPAITESGLAPEYKKARGKHSSALRVLQDGLADLDFEMNVDSLGDG